MPCMYARSKYNYTPADFDLYFNYTAIPKNIKLTDATNLSKRLQQLMPLTKTLHLNLETKIKDESQEVGVSTDLHLTVNDKYIGVKII